MLSRLNVCALLLTPLLRLARFYSDAQELLFSGPQFVQLSRLWRQLNAMSNFMNTLRTHPEQVSGQCPSLLSAHCKNTTVYRSTQKVSEVSVGGHLGALGVIIYKMCF